MKIEKFKGNGNKLFSLMYDIIGRVKENMLSDARISEQDLANKFCNFFLEKITNIRDKLRDNSRFVVEKQKNRNARIQSGIRVLFTKDNREKQGRKLEQTPSDPN